MKNNCNFIFTYDKLNDAFRKKMEKNDKFDDATWNYNFYIELILQYYRLCSILHVEELYEFKEHFNKIHEAILSNSLQGLMFRDILELMINRTKNLKLTNYRHDNDYFEHSFALLLTYENAYSLHVFGVPDDDFMMRFKEKTQYNIHKYHLDKKEWYKIIDLRFWEFCPLDVPRISNEMSLLEIKQERASSIYLSYGDEISKYIIKQSLLNIEGENNICKTIEAFIDYLNDKEIEIGKLLHIDAIGNESFMPQGDLLSNKKLK